MNSLLSYVTGKPGKGSYWTLDSKCDEMFENGNYRRRKRRPKQLIPNGQKSSTMTSSSGPLDESSLSSSDSNQNSLIASLNNENDEVHSSNTYDGYPLSKGDSSISPDTKKRQRSPSPSPPSEHRNQTKKVKTVSAFSSIDALIAPSKQVKSIDQYSPPSRLNQNQHHLQHPNVNSHVSQISPIPSQYLSLLSNGFPINLPYNRAFSTK